MRIPSNEQKANTRRALLFSLGCGLLLAGCAHSNPWQGFEERPPFNDRVLTFAIDPEVKVCIDAPSPAQNRPGKKLTLIFYALPNGNTIEQTIGRKLKPGDDWHFNIQHIGAQTRFLRDMLPDRNIVVVYLEANAKTIPRSWPVWRKKNGDSAIPKIIATIRKKFAGQPMEVVLSSHSGGGSFIFGYLNTVETIPNDIARVAFLDSDYAYDPALGHEKKLAHWLGASGDHHLCVLAYDDYAALLNGKHFVSANGGTWGRTHAMIADLGTDFSLTHTTNGDLEKVSGLNGQIEFRLMENPQKKILHTVQVEKNGFIEAMVSGTTNEGRGFQYFGDRAYLKWIEDQ